MDLGLLQREAAARIGVHVTTLANWEVGRTSPALAHLPGLFEFLGYVPYDPAGPRPMLLRHAGGCWYSRRRT